MVLNLVKEEIARLEGQKWKRCIERVRNRSINMRLYIIYQYILLIILFLTFLSADVSRCVVVSTPHSIQL